jgi:hypothetical protein
VAAKVLSEGLDAGVDLDVNRRETHSYPAHHQRRWAGHVDELPFTSAVLSLPAHRDAVSKERGRIGCVGGNERRKEVPVHIRFIHPSKAAQCVLDVASGRGNPRSTSPVAEPHRER